MLNNNNESNAEVASSELPVLDAVYEKLPNEEVYVVMVMTVTRHFTYRLRPWNTVVSKTDTLLNSQTLTWNTLLTINACLYSLIRQSLTFMYLAI